MAKNPGFRHFWPKWPFLANFGKNSPVATGLKSPKKPKKGLFSQNEVKIPGSRGPPARVLHQPLAGPAGTCRDRSPGSPGVPDLPPGAGEPSRGPGAPGSGSRDLVRDPSQGPQGPQGALPGPRSPSRAPAGGCFTSTPRGGAPRFPPGYPGVRDGKAVQAPPTRAPAVGGYRYLEIAKVCFLATNWFYIHRRDVYLDLLTE